MPPKDEEKLYTEEEVNAKIDEEKRVWDAQKRFDDLEGIVRSHEAILDDHETRITNNETGQNDMKQQVKEIHGTLVAVDSKPKKFWGTYKEFIQNVSGTLTLLMLLGGVVTWLVLSTVKPPQTVASPTVITK